MTRAICMTLVGIAILLVTPASALDRGYYNTGYEYLPVQDDAELGEILLFDIIAQGFGLPLTDVIYIHNQYDLYPEEIAMALHLARVAERDIDYVCKKRSDERYAWKSLAEKMRVAPEDLGQSSRWYRQGRPDDWWQEDVEVEREVMTDMLAGAFGVDRRVLVNWAKDGLGYGDTAIALEMERRSGKPAEEILYLKIERQARWDEVADTLRVHIDDLHAKRSLHYHDREFRSYLDPSKVYHPQRTTREHRTRREYHFYNVWVEPPVGYFRFDYHRDYDWYFGFGRVGYAYWYPPHWDYGRIYPSCHWTTSVFHPVHRPAPIYIPPPRPVRAPVSPTPPPPRDTRRYALQLADTGTRSVVIPGGSSDRAVRSVPRDSAAPMVTRDISAAERARQESRDRQRAAEASERSASRKSPGPTPRVSSSPAPRSSSSPAPRSGSTSSRDTSPSPPPAPPAPRTSGGTKQSPSPPSAPSRESASPSKPAAPPPASPPSAPSGRSGSRKGGG